MIITNDVKPTSVGCCDMERVGFFGGGCWAVANRFRSWLGDTNNNHIQSFFDILSLTRPGEGQGNPPPNQHSPSMCGS